MKNINKIRLLCNLAIVIVLSSSCKDGDWYDVKSDKNLSVPTTLKDLQELMDNAQILNTCTPGMGEVASDGHYVSDIVASKLVNRNLNAYTWSHDQTNEVVPDWNNAVGSYNTGSYSRIYYANLVLDQLKKIVPLSQIEKGQWNDIKGQALFHRAHAFYELAQVFAPPYEMASASIKLGIPLRLESDITIPSRRSNLQQTYDQIINDLMSTKGLLPLNSTYKTRPSQIALFALLARIYLSMENYEQAKIYAELCLNNYNTLMDYNTLDATLTTNPIKGYNPEVIFYSLQAENYTTLFFTNILIDRSLYDSYERNDLRRKIFFNENMTTGLITYKGSYDGRGFVCFSGLATDEVYLIKAECYARVGKATEAMRDLNTLLRMRWNPNMTTPSKSYVEIVASDGVDALRKVLEERKKELILRGLRWSDLRRLNRDSRFAVTLNRTVGGKTYTIEPNSYKYTFPIPDDIIRLTGIEQNEGW